MLKMEGGGREKMKNLSGKENTVTKNKKSTGFELFLLNYFSLFILELQMTIQLFTNFQMTK